MGGKAVELRLKRAERVLEVAFDDGSRFALPAAAPILMNVVMIAFLVFGWWSGGNVGLWQIWSVPVSGLAQLALVWALRDERVTSLVLGAGMLWYAVRVYRERTGSAALRATRGLFKFSILYLFLLFAVLLIEACRAGAGA